MDIYPIPKTFSEMQNLTARLLNECGYIAVTDQLISLSRGKKKIDVVSYINDRGQIFTELFECKLWHSKVNKDVIQGFKSTVLDSGARAGFIISTSGFQKGCQELISHSNIFLKSWSEFQEQYYDKWLEFYFQKNILETNIDLGQMTDPYSSLYIPLKNNNPEENKYLFSISFYAHIAHFYFSDINLFPALTDRKHDINNILKGAYLFDKIIGYIKCGYIDNYIKEKKLFEELLKDYKEHFCTVPLSVIMNNAQKNIKFIIRFIKKNAV